MQDEWEEAEVGESFTAASERRRADALLAATAGTVPVAPAGTGWPQPSPHGSPARAPQLQEGRSSMPHTRARCTPSVAVPPPPGCGS